jgi:hypothetical protein
VYGGGAGDVGLHVNLKKRCRSCEQVRWNADRENSGEENKTLKNVKSKHHLASGARGRCYVFPLEC